MNNKIKQINSLIGKEILTIYGPSVVVGIIKQDGKTHVHLKEFGEEDYTVNIEDWDSLIPL